MAWYIEYTLASPQADEITPKIVEAATLPAATGDIFATYGPYSTKALAQAALSKGVIQDPPASNSGSSPGQILNDVSSGVTNALGIPTFTNTRDFVSRAIRVVAGMVMLFIGLDMLVKESTSISIAGAAKDVAKVAA